MFTDIADNLALAGISKGIAIGLALSRTAVLLALALLSFYVVMRGLRVAANGNDTLAEFFADLFEKLALMAVIFWLIEPSIGTYPSLIRNWIWDPMMALVGIAQGGNGFTPNTNGLRVFEGAIDGFQDGLISVLTDPRRTGPMTNASTGIPFVGELLGGLLPILMVGLVCIILWAAKAIIVASYCTGIVMFAVGAAVGPIFIAFLINDRLENYFWSWLRFMLVAASTLLVSVIIIGVLQTALPAYIGPDSSQVSTAFQQLTANAAAGVSAPVDYLKVAGLCVLLALFLAYVLSQASEIANALFSGNASSIKSGIRPLGNLGKSVVGGAVGIGKRTISVATPKKPSTPSPGGKNGSGGGKLSPTNGGNTGYRPGTNATPRINDKPMGFQNRGGERTAMEAVTDNVATIAAIPAAGTLADTATRAGVESPSKVIARTTNKPALDGPPITRGFPFITPPRAATDTDVGSSSRVAVRDNAGNQSPTTLPAVNLPTAATDAFRSQAQSRMADVSTSKFAAQKPENLPGAANQAAVARVLGKLDSAKAIETYRRQSKESKTLQSRLSDSSEPGGTRQPPTEDSKE